MERVEERGRDRGPAVEGAQENGRVLVRDTAEPRGNGWVLGVERAKERERVRQSVRGRLRDTDRDRG